MRDDPASDVHTALRDKLMPDIMVAQDIVERNIILAPEPSQVFRGQVAAPENQVDGIDFDGAAGTDKVGHNDVRDAENLHPYLR